MKVPNWFLVGCGLLVLNAFIVLGGALTRHATAEPPDAKLAVEEPPTLESSAQAEVTGDSELGSSNDAQASESSESTRTATGNDLAPGLPKVPSLDELPKPQATAGILSVEDFKQVFSQEGSPATEVEDDLLSHTYFDALKLRLKTVEHLTKSSQGLVDEAAILFQRGEIHEAQRLIGMATQLRELAATLLVSRL